MAFLAQSSNLHGISKLRGQARTHANILIPRFSKRIVLLSCKLEQGHAFAHGIGLQLRPERFTNDAFSALDALRKQRVHGESEVDRVGLGAQASRHPIIRDSSYSRIQLPVFSMI